MELSLSIVVLAVAVGLVLLYRKWVRAWNDETNWRTFADDIEPPRPPRKPPVAKRLIAHHEEPVERDANDKAPEYARQAGRLIRQFLVWRFAPTALVMLAMTLLCIWTADRIGAELKGLGQATRHALQQVGPPQPLRKP
jgi:hypothetical protein